MTFRTIIRLIATSAFVFIAGTATSSSLTERVNETIRLGKAFGLTLDINFAYEQANVLNETFFSKFRQFKDLNIENITRFVFENPDQFWVINATGLLDGYAGPTGMNTICTIGVNDGYLELRLVDENTEGASFDTQVGVVTL